MTYDDLDLENSDDLQDEQSLDEDMPDQDASESPDDESSEAHEQNNLVKALQEERRKRREAEQRVAQREADLQRANAFLERLGQGQFYANQPNPEVYREALQTWLLERPDEFVASIQQQAHQSVIRQVAPLLASQTERIVSKNAEHKTAFEDPDIREALEAYVMNEIQTGGIERIEDLQEVVPKVMDWIVKIRKPVPQNGGGVDPARQRMTSIAQRGSSGIRKSPEQRLRDLEALAKTNPRKYVEEMKKPEVRAFVNEAVFSKKRSPT